MRTVNGCEKNNDERAAAERPLPPVDTPRPSGLLYLIAVNLAFYVFFLIIYIFETRN